MQLQNELSGLQAVLVFAVDRNAGDYVHDDARPLQGCELRLLLQRLHGMSVDIEKLAAYGFQQIQSIYLAHSTNASRSLHTVALRSIHGTAVP